MRSKKGFTIVERAIIAVPDFVEVKRKLEIKEYAVEMKEHSAG